MRLQKHSVPQQEKNITNQRSMTKLTSIVIMLIFLLGNSSASADELHFVLNGLSHHTKSEPDKKYNEENFGFGLQYDFNNFDRNLVPFLNAGGFYDSNNNPSYYIGSGLTHRTSIRNRKTTFHIDAGVTLFFMSRVYDDASENEYVNGNRIIPGALPVISIGTDTTAVNITYIPEMDETKTSVWFVQLKMKINSF